MTIEDSKKEILHWKFVAAYLASCHAATLESLPKSASKSNRERHVKICKNAAEFLRGKNSPRAFQEIELEIEAAIIRCEKAANLMS